MVIIDKGEQLSLTDARIKEESFRKEYNGNLNMKKAYISEEEMKERDKEYYENNKEILSEKKKEYYENNKEIINEKRKEYYENNKEIIHEKEKEYREKNKEKIEAKQGMKITCACGCQVRKDSLKDHLKTKKHKKLMEAK